MRYKWLPVFQLHHCSGCRACQTYCASDSIKIEDGTVVFRNPEACLSDGLCVEACPHEGIRMEWRELKGKNLRGQVVEQKPLT